MSNRIKKPTKNQHEIDIFDKEFSDILFKINNDDIAHHKQNRMNQSQRSPPTRPQPTRGPPPLPSFDKIRQEEVLKQQKERIKRIESPKQQEREEEKLKRQLLLFQDRLRLCHNRLQHEKLENERLHQQNELREKEEEIRQEELSFGQDQLNQHEELERERRNKSKGGTRKKSRRYKKSRKSSSKPVA